MTCIQFLLQDGSNEVSPGSHTGMMPKFTTMSKHEYAFMRFQAKLLTTCKGICYEIRIKCLFLRFPDIGQCKTKLSGTKGIILTILKRFTRQY